MGGIWRGRVPVAEVQCMLTKDRICIMLPIPAVEEHEEDVKLKKINREINSLKRKLTSLEKQKISLLDDKNRRKSSK